TPGGGRAPPDSGHPRWRRPRGPREKEAGQAAQRHVDPREAVVELVAHLVERLVELEDGEGAVERRTRARAEPDGRLRRRGQVPVEERLDRQPPPGVADRRSRALLAERRRDRIVERPQHPRDVLERALLRATLLGRADRLPFEVQDHEPVVGAERLAEVVVTVDADLAAALDGQRRQAVEGRVERGPGREERLSPPSRG